MGTSIASAKKKTPRATLHAAKPRSGTFHKVLLLCGIFSSLYYVAVNIIVPLYYPGYSISAQTVSELSAIDAPTRQLWVSLCIFYSILVMAFSCGVLLSADKTRKLSIAGTIMFFYGFSGFFWPPMHQRAVLAAGGGSMTDTMHIVFTIVTILFMMLMMGFGAAALGRNFRLLTMVCFVFFVVFGTMTSLEGPKISQDLPTPLIGIWERLNIGIFILWMIIFSMQLLRMKHVLKMNTHGTL